MLFLVALITVAVLHFLLLRFVTYLFSLLDNKLIEGRTYFTFQCIPSTYHGARNLPSGYSVNIVV